MSNLKCELIVNKISLTSLFHILKTDQNTKGRVHVYMCMRACIKAEGINRLWWGGGLFTTVLRIIMSRLFYISTKTQSLQAALPIQRASVWVTSAHGWYNHTDWCVRAASPESSCSALDAEFREHKKANIQSEKAVIWHFELLLPMCAFFCFPRMAILVENGLQKTVIFR